MKWIAVLNFLAFCVHSYLAHLHYSLHYNPSPTLSVCNVNAVFNCDAAALSPYSEIFGIPIALVGAIVHLLLACVAMLRSLETMENLEAATSWIFFVSMLTSIVSVGMAVVSVVALSSYCLFCIATYALSFASTVLAFSAWRKLKTSPRLVSYLGEYRAYTVALALTLPTGVLANLIIKKNFNSTKMDVLVQESLMNWQSQKLETLVPLGVEKPSETVATSPAQMVITEYIDYLCPACRASGYVMDHFIKNKTGVKLVVKPYPVDGECNSVFPKRGGVRCSLSLLALCFRNEPERAWRLHSAILEMQPFWTSRPFDDNLKELALRTQEETAALEECLQSEATKADLQILVDEATRLKIEQTPTIYINQKRALNAQVVQILERILQEIKTGPQ